MLLTVLSYAMIAIFMYVIMQKKLSPFTALVIIPLVFTLIAMATGVTSGNIGEFVLEGVTTTSKTGIMLLFAILYFSIMLDTGLFDPITKKMIHFAKGDPMKVLMATAVVAATVSLNGDGTTTTLICCSAFIPIYKKLNMNLMNLAVLVILQNTIMNLLPWGVLLLVRWLFWKLMQASFLTLLLVWYWLYFMSLSGLRRTWAAKNALV